MTAQATESCVLPGGVERAPVKDKPAISDLAPVTVTYSRWCVVDRHALGVVHDQRGGVVAERGELKRVVAGDFSAGAFRKHLPGGGGQLRSHPHSESGEPIVPGQLMQALLRQLARRGGVAP
jgi:hypothetical protein